MIAEGRIGEPRLITATLGYSMGDKPRIMRADLCGGALLDLGVYAINFVSMFCDAPFVDITSQCVKSATGMDLTNAITITLANGVLANVQSSASCVGDNIGVIAGTEGNIIIDNINNPQTVTLNGPDRTFVSKVAVPRQITGYEYQFIACRKALADGLLEEVRRCGSHLVALSDGRCPEAYLGLLALPHLVGDALHLPQGQQRQPYGQCQHYQFQSLLHNINS